MLEEFVARHNAGVNKEQPATLANQDKQAVRALAYYESLHQALASMIPDRMYGAHEFEFTLEHIRAASSTVTPAWMHHQLEAQFSFKPVLRKFMADQDFVQNILNHAPVVAETDVLYIKTVADQETRLRQQAKTIADLQEEIDYIKTPADEARPEVLEKLNAVAKALKMDDLVDSEQDAYYRRNAISMKIKTYSIKVARLEAEKEALEILETIEKSLGMEVDKDDHKAARLDRVLGKLRSDDPSESVLATVEHALLKKELPVISKATRKIELRRLPRRLNLLIKNPSMLVPRHVRRMLETVENELNIDISENPYARKKGVDLITKLSSCLEVDFEKGTSLNDQKNALRGKIQALIGRVNDLCDNDHFTRETNNEIARQLGIEDYESDASVDDQVEHIEEVLRELDEEVDFAGRPLIYDRTTVIEDKLDRQMDRLGPKPRYILDRELAAARRAEKGAEDEQESVIDAAEKALGLKPAPSDTHEQRVTALINKQLQQTSDSYFTDPKTRQLMWEQRDLQEEIASGEANIEIMREARQAAEEAVKKDGGSFQYTPEQAEVLKDIHKFTLHPLKRQALEATIGLKKAAVKSGKGTLLLMFFDFDNELAPIRLQARIGGKLTFEQTSQIVETFKSLEAAYPEPSTSEEADPRDIITTVEILAARAWIYIEKGAQEYDDEICRMGSAFVEHQPEDLKSFSEYFDTHSATGNKIITLLREGLISKVELEHYIKAIRGADGYQTVAEFKHFLGDKHGVRMPEFKKAVRMLSDEGAGAFMQSAFTPVTVTATGPAGMKESVVGLKEYAAAIIANFVLDDIAFDNGRRTAAFLSNLQDTLTPYANAAGISESEFIMVIHDTLMQAHVADFGRQLFDYWIKPSASLVQAFTWYYSHYRPLLAIHTAWQAAEHSLEHMACLYYLDLTNRGDYLHRMLTPFQHWLEYYGVNSNRTEQYDFHSGIEQIAEVGGLAMPLGKAASSAILLKTGSELFTRQYNANPRMYRSIARLVPEMVKSMGYRRGIQIPLLHRVTPQTAKTLASATTGLMLGPIATVGAYAHGLISGFTYAQTLGFALASSLTFDFFMNDNKLLTQWLGGPLGRSLDRINRWRGAGETNHDYLKRTAVATPQGFNETDEAYADRVKVSNIIPGWTRHENYLQFRERRDRTMKLYENGWEQYFKNNVPKWSFSHAESVPYTYTAGLFYQSERADDKNNPPPVNYSPLKEQASNTKQLPE